MDAMRRMIVCVEDEPAILYLLEQMLGTFLNRARYEVHGLPSGTAARAFIQQHPVDLVITDYLMPEINGVQLYHAVKQCAPATPVLILTGYTDEEVRTVAQAIGVDAYLRKPFIIDAFRHTVQHLLGHPAHEEV